MNDIVCDDFEEKMIRIRIARLYKIPVDSVAHDWNKLLDNMELYRGYKRILDFFGHINNSEMLQEKLR